MKTAKILFGLSLLVLLTYTPLWANGTETLGPPVGIVLAPGTGIAAAGTGMITQPGTIEVEVPSGAAVTQVLLYWEGFMETNEAGDNTIAVSNGGPPFEATGTLIGGPTPFFPGAYASTFRADITSLGLVGPGPNSLTLSGLGFTAANNGAGVIVIYDDGSDLADIQLRDGSDLAFYDFAPPLDTTVAQRFTFAPSGNDRTASLSLFFASVAGTLSGGTIRPTVIEITVAGGASPSVTTLIDNLLNSVNGEEWDTHTIPVNVPAGATSVTVRAFSEDRLGTRLLPASFDWLAAAFALQTETVGAGCTRTPGYWKTHSKYGPAPYDSTWAKIGEETPFFQSRVSYYRAFWVPPKGNAYFILAPQFIAAKLNALAGASVPAGVQAAMTEAATLFELYTPAYIGALKGKDSLRARFITLAGILDEYNNGIIGPGHCMDKPVLY